MIFGPGLLAFTDADGWHAGIGDPTVMGWVTVIAYVSAGALALQAGRVANKNIRNVRDVSDSNKTRKQKFWYLVAALLFALGVNKQLDLQTWLTLAVRRVAIAQGWYEQRRPVQILFILGIAIGAAGGLAAVWWLIAKQIGELWLPLIGLCLLFAFVVIRAASFHHVDQFLHFKVAGVKMNWLFELSGIVIVGMGALQQSRREAVRLNRPAPAARLA